MVSVRPVDTVASEQNISASYYISSEKFSAKGRYYATRAHWNIASMNWQLDVSFKEDACRIRVDDRADALSRIWQVCLNPLKQETGFKCGALSKVLVALV